MIRLRSLRALALCLFTASPFIASGRDLSPRILVKYKGDSQARSALAVVESADDLKSMSTHASTNQLEIISLANHMNEDEMKDYVDELAAQPNVEYAELDLPVYRALEPGDGGLNEDPLYFSQWHYRELAGGINLPAAWDITTGSSSTVVAVLDTGIISHPDLSGRVVTGIDLVSDPTMGNDGDGRDTNPTDPGDWVTSGDSCFRGRFESSSWHGTHVAGTIAANANNGIGGVGVNWQAKILPVRVLGKCGGYTSDIADGIRWAVGLNVAGVPVNRNPAKVINLSLGGFGSCSRYLQEAINAARARGAVIVVAAGNEESNLDEIYFSPANCAGVITVAAGERNGDLASYSNYGQNVDLLAPGGSDLAPVLSAHNSGSTTIASYTYRGLKGTSMAAPHVSGVASLIFGINSGLYPDQVKDVLQRSARSFASFGQCDREKCGHGLVDAYEALDLADGLAPDASFSLPEVVINSLSPDDSSPARFEISETSGGGFCGTIDTGGGPGNGSGPGSMLPSLALMLALGLIFQIKMGKGRFS